MDARLQEMLDHHEITKVLSQYCHGCDRCDEPLMAGVYARESWDDHGLNKCAGQQFTHIMVAHMLANTHSVSHLQGQSLIRVHGDEAGAETYFIAVIRVTDHAGKPRLRQMGGRYVDTLVREEGRWRIKKRVCVRDWSIELAVESDWLQGQQFVEGQRSQQDPAYAALGLQHPIAG